MFSMFMWWKRAPSSRDGGRVPWQVKYLRTPRARALSSPSSERGSEEQVTVLRNGFLMVLGLEPTQDGARPRTGMVGEGEEAGEISMMALAGVTGADISLIGAKVGMSRLLRVGGAMVGRGWIFERVEVALIIDWDSENFWTSSSAFMLSSLT